MLLRRIELPEVFRKTLRRESTSVIRIFRYRYRGSALPAGTEEQALTLPDPLRIVQRPRRRPLVQPIFRHTLYRSLFSQLCQPIIPDSAHLRAPLVIERFLSFLFIFADRDG